MEADRIITRRREIAFFMAVLLCSLHSSAQEQRVLKPAAIKLIPSTTIVKPFEDPPPVGCILDIPLFAGGRCGLATRIEDPMKYTSLGHYTFTRNKLSHIAVSDAAIILPGVYQRRRGEDLHIFGSR